MRFNFNSHSILINLEIFQGLYMLIYLTEKKSLKLCCELQRTLYITIIIQVEVKLTIYRKLSNSTVIYILDMIISTLL